MKVTINLTGRIFLLIASLIGITVTMAQISGVVRATPVEAVAGGLTLSILMAWAVSSLRAQAWRPLTAAVLESERSGSFIPNFPTNSPVPEVNRQARALNAAAASALKSREELERAHLQFIETMAQALDARDPYTAGHSLRVAEYSRELALAIGLPEEQAHKIRVAAELHDIGKIGIPDAVLQKPGRLTPAEYGLIKLHPQIGRRILEKVGRFEDVLAVVELHHENHDGSGYPYGLTGDQVPIEVRIVHVADAFDAMTTTRSYRPGLSLSEALAEIEMHAGTQFDPAVAALFIRLVKEGLIDVGKLEVIARKGISSVSIGAGLRDGSSGQLQFRA